MATPGGGREDRQAIGITIGLREIYDKVAELSAAITHLTGVVAALEVTQRNAGHDADGLESRVRQLEQKPVVTPAAMWTAIGVLATVAGVLVTIITR